MGKRKAKKIIAVIDGTMSRLERNKSTYAGQVFKLALRLPIDERRVFYDPGVQGHGATKWLQVATGEGLNHSIEKIYKQISAAYQEGDEIYLFGYSRGAYAVRLIAGMINRFGLLREEYADLHYAGHALSYYANPDAAHASETFDLNWTRQDVPIAFLGVWDTVKALGLPLPFLSRFTPLSVKFRDHSVPENVAIACHALALNENRQFFEPELWRHAEPQTQMTQMLFSGNHSVVGGDVHYKQEARKTGNYSMIWMLEQAERAGLIFHEDWRSALPTDPCAPLRDWSSWYDYLWWRKKRVFEPSEYFTIAPSVKLCEDCERG